MTQEALPAVEPPSDSRDRVDPFLRWAGGKRWLLPEVETLTSGLQINRYIEPFLGGGSIFFGLTSTKDALLSDLNEELIEVYELVKKDPDGVVEALGEYVNTAECYYSARSNVPTTSRLRAARFIFLNQTSYNGIYRVNLNGKYNVPYGNRKYVRPFDLDAARRVSAKLRTAEIRALDFEVAIAEAGPGDFLFVDPPYTVAHNNNGFVKYNRHLFNFEDQRRLAEALSLAAERGAKFIMTNAAHKSIEDLFSPLAERKVVTRQNLIGGKSAKRGKAEELLFTNLDIS
ncbi:Dam family site-specific DNA-(adenine-N6)-methyltransferase [Brevibacterium sediminis]|uniref:DNA adenine methylase n=1 Tax=Brevibacterium sediminis TaxID=1857024 RepID=UPI00217516D3|nr:Dam family site-specific DNA-(adenine-N6)-methyltransferase [Brevibacterium sediminis]MCS4594805.1 Dam family site-specific DNA-(adenine-N6)-methyltransferase [Brevibacterium sediminis]